MKFSPAILFFLVFGTYVQAAALPGGGEMFNIAQSRRTYSHKNLVGEYALLRRIPGDDAEPTGGIDRLF